MDDAAKQVDKEIDELKIIRSIITKLEELPEESRDRVWKYLCSKMEPKK